MEEDTSMVFCYWWDIEVMMSEVGLKVSTKEKVFQGQDLIAVVDYFDGPVV